MKSDIYLGFYTKLEDMQSFITKLVEKGLIYQTEEQYIHLITGHSVVMFNKKDSFHSVRGFDFKSIILLSDIDTKQKRRIERVADLIWSNSEDFIGSEFAFLNNQNELSKIIYQIENEE